MNKEFMLFMNASERICVLWSDYFESMGEYKYFNDVLGNKIFKGLIPIYGIPNTLKRSQKQLDDIGFDSSHLELIKIKDLRDIHVIKFHENYLLKSSGLECEGDEEALYYNLAIDFNLDELHKAMEIDFDSWSYSKSNE